MVTIYILKLESDKYYVGRSLYPKNRILNHFKKNGSEFTKKYKPISIYKEFEGDEWDEEKYTLKMMCDYGIDNVRGGKYCSLVLLDSDKKQIEKSFMSVKDKCYKCGSSGHFAADCKKNIKANEKCDDSDSDSKGVNNDTKCWSCEKHVYRGNCLLCKKTYEEHTYDCDCVFYTQPEEGFCDCCHSCRNTGISYWSDGIYGACLECCCIDCGKRNCECCCPACEMQNCACLI
jgi:hypothetical protein